MADAQQMRRRQTILADFGAFTLDTENLDEVLCRACELVCKGLGTARAKVMEILPGGAQLLVRAGVGWEPGVIGRLKVDMQENSSESYSIRAGRPVLTRDIAHEHRFDIPGFMKEAGVVALVNVPILVPGKSPYGLLQADAAEPRDFDEDDVQFLRTYANLLGPVVDRLQKLQDIRSGEERFQLIVENTREYAIFLTDPQDRITDWFAGAEAVFGWTADEAVGQHAAMLFTPEDLARREPEKEIETARQRGRAPDVRWHLHKDGRRVFIEGSVTALRQRDGSRTFMKLGRDVTERHKAEERQAVLVAELQHRTRNLLALVRAIVQQTQAESPTVEEFRRQFNDRLEALGRVQGLLSRSDQEPITIGTLVKMELDAIGTVSRDQIETAGPEASLRKGDVQILALALHELATNARKYGALSGRTGRLRVSWRTYEAADHARLALAWEETGIAVSEDVPAPGRGYGRKLIEEALPYSLDARTRYELSGTTLRCTIDLALTRRPPQEDRA